MDEQLDAISEKLEEIGEKLESLESVEEKLGEIKDNLDHLEEINSTLDSIKDNIEHLEDMKNSMEKMCEAMTTFVEMIEEKILPVIAGNLAAPASMCPECRNPIGTNETCTTCAAFKQRLRIGF
jgi:DNA repair exonuclease SbcCD ATPase subunit